MKRLEVGGWEVEVGGRRLKAGRQEVGGWRLEAGVRRFEVRNRGWRQRAGG